MNKSTITIDVLLDPNKIPEQINWDATDSSAQMKQKAKAMCLAFWDGADKSAMRIDLWTKDMMVDEMGDFFYQMMMTMADTFKKATQQEELSEEMKTFAKGFYKKTQGTGSKTAIALQGVNQVLLPGHNLKFCSTIKTGNYSLHIF